MGESLSKDLTISEDLTKDYLVGRDQAKQFFPRPFQAPELRKFDVDRNKLVEKLSEYNEKIEAPDPVLESVKSLARDDTYAVVTGQQPGILSGPLYTVYKALSTVSLCERFSKDRRSLVPVFWNASEDHDLSEVNHFYLFDENEARKIEYRSGKEGKPLSRQELKKSEARRMLGLADEVTPNSEFKGSIFNDIREMIEDSSTIGDFFSRFMVHFFGEHSLIMIEPRFLGDLTSPVFEKMIRNPTECTKALSRANSELENSGYYPRLHKSAKLCNFFLLDGSEGRRNVRYEGGFKVGNESYTEDDLLEILEKEPERFTSNAVTRPIIQDSVLPTFGYVAGPNETAYLGQLKGVYEHFSVEMPVIFPRFGATVVESKVEKVLEKYDLEGGELRNPERLLKKLVDGGLDEVLEEFKGDIRENLEELSDRLNEIDRELDTQREIAEKRIFKSVERMESKMRAKLKKKKKITRKQVMKAHNNLFPHGELQERCINVLEYLTKFGTDFFETVKKDFSESNCGEHRVIKCR